MFSSDKSGRGVQTTKKGKTSTECENNEPVPPGCILERWLLTLLLLNAT